MSKSVLLVVTSNERLGESGQKTGAWLEELSQAYFTFADAGWNVDIASPRGGAAPIDPASAQDPWLSELGKRFLADDHTIRLMTDSRAISDVAPDEYAAIYLVGGAGTMWDFPENRPLASLIEQMLKSGRMVAAVCHGVAGLASARKTTGELVVQGLRLTCFSNVEEEQVGYVPHLPILPQNLLTSRGALYSCAEPWLEHVVADGKILTGQNPASAGALAREVLLKIA